MGRWKQDDIESQKMRQKGRRPGTKPKERGDEASRQGDKMSIYAAPTRLDAEMGRLEKVITTRPHLIVARPSL
jgi:hypothetical protein